MDSKCCSVLFCDSVLCFTVSVLFWLSRRTKQETAMVRANGRASELVRAVSEGRDRTSLEQACERIDRAVVAATTETDSGGFVFAHLSTHSVLVCCLNFIVQYSISGRVRMGQDRR